MEMEKTKPVRKLPETIHSLLGLKSHLTSAWVKSVCNIVKNVSSESSRSKVLTVDEEDESSVSIEAQNIREQLSVLTAHVNDLNAQRRQILNELLDLKGNIRVFCRVRPIRTGKEEGLGFCRQVVSCDSRNVIVKLTDKKTKLYDFDRVFSPDSSQDDVFLEIEPVIKSVIDGYNTCIFAYGQTGTGKTFTMEGVEEQPGIVPRTMKAVFEQAMESNHTFVISFSMVEIYMGTLRDLLLHRSSLRPNHPIPPCLSIHMDATGEIEIENLVSIKVNEFKQALKLYRLGCRNRATASTNSNATSSRSHCMIRVTITCRGAEERRRETNKIWLVDLGGSERVLKTRATGRRLDEGKAINLSLSALGDVINALQRNRSHIPYRNSKLTQVLKDSLGQDSKTLMLVHVSPKEDDLCETICSLNFATRAKSIHLGHHESSEEMERKECAMRSLQTTMEKIEQDRQRVLKDIRNLNDKLEKLTGKPLPPPREEDVVTEETRSNHSETAKTRSGRFGNRMPSFMRPTVSSKRKLGRNESAASDESAINGVRSRRPMRSSRAESVSLPVKRNDFSSVCNSDRSISKSTCVLRLANADNATVYSQDTSECDVKVVVTPENKEMGSADQTKLRFNVKKDTNAKAKFSRVNSWLRSQTETRSCVQSKKGITIATPSPENLSRFNANKTSVSQFPPKIFIEDEVTEEKEIIKESKAMETTPKPTVMLKDLFELPCSCSSQPDDQILSKIPNPDDDDDDESLYPPVSGFEELSQCIDEKEEHIFMEEMMKDDDHYNPDSEQKSVASILLSERASDFMKSFDSEQFIRPKSQRVLDFANKVGVCDKEVIPPLVSPQEKSGEEGKANMVMEKAKTLWFSALLGLGFLDLGYGSDFFYGLTK